MRKENLFGFGKGSSKLQSSSRLEKQAYDAGYRGVDGWHGTHYFDAWLKGQGDKKEWSSGLVSRLKAEYKRGGVEYEADRLLEKAKAQGKVKTGGKEDKPVKYKGHRIVPVGGGEWAIPDVDRESRFESLAEAKRFVMANPTRPIYLVRSKTMYRTPPETLTSNLTGPTFKVFGGQAEIIHKGRGGRVLVKGEYDGQPFYGWLSKEDYTRTKPNPSHGPVESTVSDITRTGKSMGRYLDSQLGRFVNPAIDRVQPTLTQGDSRAYVIEMESRKYLAWVVDGSGERREREFEGARAKEAAKAWARLVLFEVAKAGVRSNPVGDGRPWLKMSDSMTLPQAQALAAKLKTQDRKLRVLGSTGNYSEVEVRQTFERPHGRKEYGVFVVMNTQENPATSPEQYRLAQAVLSGTARGAHMPVKVAREIVEKTPAAMRSEYMRTNPGYEVRFIKPSQANELFNLYHLARVPLSGTGKDTPYERMLWASKEFHKLHPEVSETGAYKDLDGLRSNWFEPAPARRGRKRRPIKHNPESSSMDMYSSFHGRPSRETVEITETIHDHDNVAALGTCCGFLIVAGSKQFAIGLSGYTWSPRADGPGKKKGGFVKTDPAADDVFLSSNEEGTQMFVDGGDQELDLSSLGITGREAEKEAVVIGDVAMVAYETEKEFDKFDLIQYVHTLSEDSKGPLPVLRYMRRNSKGARMFLDGGVYYIEKPLVGTSPGIED